MTCDVSHWSGAPLCLGVLRTSPRGLHSSGVFCCSTPLTPTRPVLRPAEMSVDWSHMSMTEDQGVPRLKVWIDQDLCTGDGICMDHAPEVFTLLEDGIAYCKEGTKVFNDPGGSAELAAVPFHREGRRRRRGGPVPRRVHLRGG